MTADGWSVSDAARESGKTGRPIAERNLRAIVRNLPGFCRTGERRPLSDDGRDLGGRGENVYSIGDFQELHGFLAGKGWLTPQDPPSGDT